jgi:hypothetical protein
VSEQPVKVGIISCSGEEIPAGTISRRATRRVLELLRPQNTVTLCLPLFLAGEEGERRFARQHPTITVDGCNKLCAKKGTEKYSGRVVASLDVSEILGDRLKGCHRSLRDGDKADEEAARVVAERIAAEVDAIRGSSAKAASNNNFGICAVNPPSPPAPLPKGEGSCLWTTAKVEETAPAGGASCGCSCGSPPPETVLQINGKPVVVPGLVLIFQHLRKKGLAPGNGCADRLLEMVCVYHAIEEGEKEFYRGALAAAYEEFCRQQL